MGTNNEEENPKKGDGTYGVIKDTSVRIHTPERFPDLFRIDMNPRVTFISCVIIWGFIFWCIFYDDANEDMKEAKAWVTDKFTWFYVGSQDLWALFMIVLYFSKYGNLKLGKADEEPEYPTVTWFTMLFACGIGVGLFYYGVAEPVWHYTYANRYWADPYKPDNELAQDAMNLAYFHWGIHGWVCYSLIGCLLGVMVYKHDLPMKMSSCFYPLLGDKVFGWIGDAIDILSIITTLFGVCTSLGLGVTQLNSGLNIMNDDIPIETWVKVVIIWVITAIATASTLSGLDIGIRRLSELCFTLGMFIMMFLALLEDPVYLLNVFVQSIGYYLNYVIYLGFHCDAFEMHSKSVMGTQRNRIADVETVDVSEWMDDWTIFYWGWWIAWSPFVGIFIAKISRGRTIREFINGTMTAPILYSFAWFAVFGGAGIGMERNAAIEGYCCGENFINKTELKSVIVMDPLTKSDYSSFCEADKCNVCAVSILDYALEEGKSIRETARWVGDDDFSYARSNDKRFVRLSCFGDVQMWFFLMESQEDVGTFLDIISLVAIIFYFVTSSDSGSFIIDTLASNGDQNPPKLQRLFWALTEGGAATALIVAGGEEALAALQTVSIVCGLPYTVILCFLCVALWRACQVSFQDLDPFAEDFSIGYLDFASEFKLNICLEWLLGFILGPYWAVKAAVRAWNMHFAMVIIMSAVTYLFLIAFVGFHLGELGVKSFWALGWVMYFSFATMMGAMRTGVRGDRGYLGNPVEDFFAALFLYPSVGQQLKHAYDDKESSYSMTHPPRYLDVDRNFGNRNLGFNGKEGVYEVAQF